VIAARVARFVRRLGTAFIAVLDEALHPSPEVLGGAIVTTAVVILLLVVGS
jgi:hypothetical protein